MPAFGGLSSTRKVKEAIECTPNQIKMAHCRPLFKNSLSGGTELAYLVG